jgi:peptide deformylase
MATREILQLGNPVLRETCAPVRSFDPDRLEGIVRDLRDTLDDVRRRNGFGRGIAAPQIGVTERLIFVDVGTPLAMVNPVIIQRSRKKMTLWDDCFSFPDLMVKVKRNLAVQVRYQDLQGRRHTLEAGGALSELLQHEIDHLNGVLAIDRAIDSRHIAYRRELEKKEKAREEVPL